MPGAESVIVAFSAEVITSPVTPRVSIASGALVLPQLWPRETIRAAVRCAMPMPSPTSMMMFLAGRAPWRGACQAPAS